MVCRPQVFPDALFHQLLLAMSHADSETRVVAHNVFSVLLLGTLCLPWSDKHKEGSDAVSETLSVDTRHTSLSCQYLSSLEEVDGGIAV